MAIKKFLRGESTYTCHCCKKLTRNVGGDEFHCKLCLDCYELAGIDNHLTDNGSLDEFEKDARRRLTARPELIPHFTNIARALGMEVK